MFSQSADHGLKFRMLGGKSRFNACFHNGTILKQDANNFLYVNSSDIEKANMIRLITTAEFGTSNRPTTIRLTSQQK